MSSLYTAAPTFAAFVAIAALAMICLTVWKIGWMLGYRAAQAEHDTEWSAAWTDAGLDVIGTRQHGEEAVRLWPPPEVEP